MAHLANAFPSCLAWFWAAEPSLMQGLPVLAEIGRLAELGASPLR